MKMENQSGSPAIQAEVKNINSHITTVGEVKLEEDIFVNVFLPVFAGNESIYGTTIKDWFERFGPFTEVSVIDQEGNVIFKVPPFFDNKIIHSQKEGDERIADILDGAVKRSYIHPAQGERFINERFNGVFNRVIEKENGIEHLRVWNGIFNRYGYPGFLNEASVEEDNSSLSILEVQSYDPI